MQGMKPHYPTDTARARVTTVVAMSLIALGAFFLVLAVLVTREFVSALLLLGVGFLALKLDLSGASKGLRNAALGFGGLLAVMGLSVVLCGLLAGTALQKIIILVAAVGAFVVGRVIVARMLVKHHADVDTANQQADAHNQTVTAHADQLAGAYQESAARLAQKQTALQQFIHGWYPPDYLSHDAIGFFIGQFRNLKADSIKEAVNQFDEAGYRRAMLDANQQILQSQEQMQRQLRRANVINLAQLATQVATAQRVGELTDEVSRLRYPARSSAI